MLSRAHIAARRKVPWASFIIVSRVAYSPPWVVADPPVKRGTED